jgi:predicted ATPase
MCGAVISSPLLLTFLAGAFFKLGQPGDGVSRLHEAAQFIENTDERYCEAEVYRLTADLLKMTGDQAVAEQSYCKALALADRQNAKAHQLRTAISMARLWRDQGKRDEARDLLAPVYGWFTEGFDTLDLKEAKKLLNELVWPLSGDRD